MKVVVENNYFVVENTMTVAKKNAWVSFKEVVAKFLGNNKDPNYITMIKNMLDNMKKLSCNMNIKFHFPPLLHPFFSKKTLAM